ncbi:hypothetical protein [Aestuariicoccus sp. MJ-SS9]|uniref:hypothetical protein n=1 Tax=Aestuariicoccus sp. MJ-SS9 TaxID=3079855 RepID=UPI0029103C27|nr:hypothetical protein [Aestuariicoccus sp. MJ-SS9]MDU8910826.1 hypothetical protein [Aestuariicoccus sp. MJ-SS9]
MTRAVRITLLTIAAALAFMVGTFVWFVVTWDAEAEKSLTQNDAPLLLLGENTPGSGAAPRSAAGPMTEGQT